MIIAMMMLLMMMMMTTMRRRRRRRRRRRKNSRRRENDNHNDDKDYADYQKNAYDHTYGFPVKRLQDDTSACCWPTSLCICFLLMHTPTLCHCLDVWAGRETWIYVSLPISNRRMLAPHMMDRSAEAQG